MKLFPSLLPLIAVSGAMGCSQVAGAQAEAAPLAPPPTIILDGGRIAEVRARIQKGDHAFDGALAKLKSDADKAMKRGPFSVTQKEVLPPSKDKHDYLSQSVYWWPNPATPNGLPYVQRDGQVNPESKKINDEAQMLAMARSVETLAQSWYFSGNRDHAARAELLLRTWFLDAATRMNPHLQYAQIVPGRNPDGRSSGIVDTEAMIKVPDAVTLLADDPSWTPGDQAGLKKWFGDYADWLLHSKNGQAESLSTNNHGTVYDAQVVAFTLFAGKRDEAEKVLREIGSNRIAKMVEADGRQPAELRRTKAWQYSQKNLQSLIWLATMGDKVGVDLWHFQTSDGRSIKAALDYLMPFGSGEKEWTYARLDLKPDQKPKILNLFLRRAALKFNEPRYKLLLQQYTPDYASEREQLLWPL